MSSPSLQAVVVLLSNIADELERIWIQRDAFGEALFKADFTPQQIKKISDDALADPERQRRSREAYAQIVGSENSEPLIPEILSRSALEGEASSKFR